MLSMDQALSRSLAATLMGTVLFAMTGCGGSDPAVIPSTYAHYNSPGGTFACDQPEGWEVKKSTGKVEWAKFKSGSAEIAIRTDVSGSLMAGPSGGRGSEENEDPTFAPVHGLHVDAMDKAAETYSDYEEVQGPDVIDVKLGPARISEFTAATTFGTFLHGYRATILAHDKRATVYAVCTENEWSDLKPVFDKVIESMERGESEI